MSKLYRGSSIDASYQVSVHLAKGFQRRRLKCEKLTNNRRRMPSDGKSSYCLWQGELKIRVQNCIWTMTNRANLFSCQITYLRLVMNYENPEYTHWSYVKTQRKMVYLRLCSRNTNNHTGSRFIKLHLVAVFTVRVTSRSVKAKSFWYDVAKIKILQSSFM